MQKKNGPRVLILDIENWPMKGDFWDLWDQNIGLGQIDQHKTILSFAAKWWGEKEVFYHDVSNRRNLHCDKPLMNPLRELIEAADILVGHNIQKFDRRVINASAVANGEKPIGKSRILDTMLICKKHFNFPSYSLEYLTSRLCPEFKKMKSKVFIGHELWRECDRRNPEAWKEMRLYNCADVRATEALWNVIEPFDSSINFNVYTDNPQGKDCKCGGEFRANGRYVAGLMVKQRYRCSQCGAEAQGRTNLIAKEKRNILRKL